MCTTPHKTTRWCKFHLWMSSRVGFVFLVIAALSCTEAGKPPPSTDWDSDIPMVVGQNHHGGRSDNRAPVLKRIGDRMVVVGEPFSLSLEALDPDNDPLSYAVFGGLPPDAKFHKLDGRLDWIPAGVVAPFYLTFQVSDGVDIDRETVRLSTTMQKENQPPSFVKIGDQAVQPGVQLAMSLEATDPNSDPLLYEIDGDAPEGSKLDPESGLFQWNIPEALTGSTIRVGFRVTDGTLSDTMEIKFIVSQGAGTPSPPVFVPAGPFDAAIDTPLSFYVQAVDPDGELVRYSIDGAKPEAAVFDQDTGAFQWTPPASAVGSSVLVVFSATDGVFVSYMEVNIFVFLPGPEEFCDDDAFEPNNNTFAAYPLSAGFYSDLSICDSQTSPVDVDWFLVDVWAGQTVEANIVWDSAGKELSVSVALLWPGNITADFVSGSVGVEGDLSTAYTATSNDLLFIVVYGEEPVKYAESYTLSIEVGAGASDCADDTYDQGIGNDIADNALPVDLQGGLATLGNLKLCPSDLDWFSFNLVCGSVLEIRANSELSDLDIDMFLYKADVPTTILESGVSINNPEEILLDPVPATGDYRLSVEAFPNMASGPYSLEVSVDASALCTDDVDEPNDSVVLAAPLAPNSGVLDRKICCSDDFYSVQVDEGQEIKVSIGFSSGTGSLRLIRFQGQQEVANQSGSTVDASWEADTSGQVIVHVSGATVGQAYTLSVTVEAAATGCDAMSCPAYEVCDPLQGCISDFCHEDKPCPLGFICLDTFCVDSCVSDTHCRVDKGYLCKAFPEGRFCGVSGDDPTGSACFWFSSCAGSAACMLKDYGGYCAAAGCTSDLSCEGGTSCTLLEGEYLCAKGCAVDEECRVSADYACLATPHIDMGIAKVCAPDFVPDL